MRHTYALEYGCGTIGVKSDAAGSARVVLVDDLATGGTMAAAITLLEQVGAVVPAAACIIVSLSSRGPQKLRWRSSAAGTDS